ncbi:tetratricopeptide repeat protein [Croceivirga thetidis]|uniref:Tetratricopeptide repeat protein n=1 Tax=Croceivirga thetidis TaxID=2721623 RepID=A0ABX1GRX8_9FLAO|nr:tetratricopeptide repeat protein [Croceivirga thetidis]NKI32388.1 tetratricopeptide repeat protein [Croceivirga thetidis]
MKNISQILFFAFSIPFFTFSQSFTNIDSLLSDAKSSRADTNKIRTLERIWKYYLDNDTDKSMEYANQVLNLSKELKYAKGLGLGHLYRGAIYSQLSEFEKSSNEFKKSFEIFKGNDLKKEEVLATSNIARDYFFQSKYDSAVYYNSITEKALIALGDSLKLGSTYLLNSSIYLEQGYFQLSLKNGLKSAEIFKKLGDEVGYAKGCYVVACVHESLNNRNEALKYYYESIPIFKQYNSNYTLALAYEGLTILYNKEPFQKDSAEVNIKKAIALAEEMKDSILLTTSLNEFGNIKFLSKDFENAERIYQKSLAIANEINSGFSKQILLLDLGELYLQKKEFNQAINYSMQALRLCDSLEIEVGVNRSFEILYQANKEKNNLVDAIKYLELQKEKSDSIYGKETKNRVNELQTIYETEKKEAALALQEKEIQTLNQEVEISNLRKGLYAGGMASALALSGLLIFGFRQRMKKNRIAREKQEEIYKQEIAHKKKELASQTLHLVQKNTFLEELKENLENLKSSPDKFKMEFRRIVMLLKKEKASDKDWETFKTYFSEVHNDFDQKLKTLYGDISEKEIRLAAFLRMNLTTKEIAATLNVLPDSILKSKYRLKKKLGLNKETDLTSFLNTL